MFLTVSIVMALALGSCQQPTQNASLAAQEQEQTPAPNITECDVKIGNVAFTHALNGGDTCISIMQGENNLTYSISGDPADTKSPYICFVLENDAVKEIDISYPLILLKGE